MALYDYVSQVVCHTCSKGARRANWDMSTGPRKTSVQLAAQTKIFVRVALWACFQQMIWYLLPFDKCGLRKFTDPSRNWQHLSPNVHLFRAQSNLLLSFPQGCVGQILVSLVSFAPWETAKRNAFSKQSRDINISLARLFVGWFESPGSIMSGAYNFGI